MEDSSPGWPSLYSPGVELIGIEHRPPEQPRGVYLHHYRDIFSFTLYWTLVLYTPVYFMCAGVAFYNVTFPGRKRNHDGEWWEMQLLRHSRRPRKTNERRSRLTFALIVLLVFMAMSVLGALIGSTITSAMMLALWRSGNYSMSTCVQFLTIPYSADHRSAGYRSLRL
ncbi:hypothetical protein CPB85DRAFT_1428539 [Mucidula mucida]|nr:hypothetical protein CPB85DRAFT_1428539 [Mucidula mucida]